MTLRQKISWQVGATLAGLLLVGGTALWGINGLHQDYGVALEGDQRLRHAFLTGSHLRTAQTLLQWPHPQAVAAARSEVEAAQTAFRPLADLPPAGGWDAAAALGIRIRLDLIRANLSMVQQPPLGGPPNPELVAAQRDAVVAQVGRIAELSAGIRRATEAAQAAAAAKRRATAAVVGWVCGLVVLGATVCGVLHYRGVMTPVRRLTDGVRLLADGHFKERVDDRGRDELADLAREFNRMAAELDGLYHQLEQKVADKSRELVRSDRLASVGYLAAGVAHEINNPLSIISGYAEYSLAELGKLGGRGAGGTANGGTLDSGTVDGEYSNNSRSGSGGGPAAVTDDVARSLRVICDEAFRCKGITEQLLSLARGGGGNDEARQPVSMLTVAEEVAAIVGGLRDHRDKRLVVRAAERSTPEAAAGDGGRPAGRADDPADDFVVSAVGQEMKQVVLNLAVNALEAVPPGVGEVRIDVRRVPGPPLQTGPYDFEPGNDWVELAVSDNGRGMSADTRDRAFEPFFTDRRAARDDGRRGTGLGLSITHAIVRGHGGTITAESDGPGTGSRFVVRLPAAVRAPAAAGVSAPA